MKIHTLFDRVIALVVLKSVDTLTAEQEKMMIPKTCLLKLLVQISSKSQMVQFKSYVQKKEWPILF